MKNQVVSLAEIQAKTTETLKVENAANRSRLANDELRGKRHLTLDEVSQICEAIHKKSRNPGRDELMVLMAFHHGFRVSELTSVKWQHIDLKSGQLSVRRMKNGIDTVHPISDKRELMLLRRIHRDQLKPTAGFVFRNERGNPVSVNGFQKMFGKYSEQALVVKWNSHSLRHACGTALIDKGHDLRTVQVYMGHRNIQNTTVYLHESAKQFDKIEW
jgi:integrase